jgi:hypothetical protein
MIKEIITDLKKHIMRNFMPNRTSINMQENNEIKYFIKQMK